MATYTVMDFSESIVRVQMPARPKRVILAWGCADPDSGTDWSGGFMMELLDGQYAVLTGWCDYTGWGCQDSAEVAIYPNEPEASAASTVAAKGKGIETTPVDLNKWIDAGMPTDRVWEWEPKS